MGRIKDLNSSVPGETDNLVFDGLNGTKRISYADFKQKLIDDGFGSGSSEAVVLTQAEYDALPDEVKDSDTIFFISDAPFENSNVVTLTSAQYAALSDATKMDGRFYYVTDEEEVAKSLVVQENVNSTETVPSSAVLYAESTLTTPVFRSGSVNVASQYYANGYVRLIKIGKMVFVTVHGLTFSNQTSSLVNHICSMETMNWWPLASAETDVSFGCLCRNAGNIVGEIHLTNGQVDFRTSGPAPLYGEFFYPTDA